MPKYKVLPEQGIDKDGKRYEAGDSVELSAAEAKWLVDSGRVAAPAKKRKAK